MDVDDSRYSVRKSRSARRLQPALQNVLAGCGLGFRVAIQVSGFKSSSLGLQVQKSGRF